MGTVDKLTELQYRRSVINNGGGEVKIKKQHDSGKLTARERCFCNSQMYRVRYGLC